MNRHRPSQVRALALSLLSFVLFLGCSEEPDQVYQRALDARRAKDQAAYLACFTVRSQRVLERLDEVEEMTRKKLVYLQKPFTLLPEGTPLGTAREKGNVARLTVKGGRQDIEIVLLKEQGEWRIEALELDAFWAPMMRSAEIE